MTRPDLREHAQRERATLLGLLGGLTEDQWATRSLCKAWSVRDVAVHIVSYDEMTKLGVAGAFLGGGFRVSSVNEVALARYSDLEPTGVVDLVERCQVPRGLTAAMGCGIALTDGTIHQQDIRRSLGLPRVIPTDQLREVLDFALSAPTLPVKKNTRGLRLVATDLDWSVGAGPEVSGPGEALLMAAAGRSVALAELQGAGISELASRLESA